MVWEKNLNKEKEVKKSETGATIKKPVNDYASKANKEDEKLAMFHVEH